MGREGERRGRRGVGVSGTVGAEAGSVSRVRTRVKMESEVAKDWMRSKLSRMFFFPSVRTPRATLDHFHFVFY